MARGGGGKSGGSVGRGVGTLHALRQAIWVAQSVADECGVRRGLGVLVRALLRELRRVPNDGVRLAATALFIDSGLFAGSGEPTTDVPIVGGVTARPEGLCEDGRAAEVDRIPRQERLLEILRSLVELGIFLCLLAICSVKIPFICFV